MRKTSSVVKNIAPKTNPHKTSAITQQVSKYEKLINTGTIDMHEPAKDAPTIKVEIMTKFPLDGTTWYLFISHSSQLGKMTEL